MANIEFVPLEDSEHLVVCRGRYGCGNAVLGEMEFEHLQWHQRKGDPVELPEGGANDPGPMPPKE